MSIELGIFAPLKGRIPDFLGFMFILDSLVH